MKYILTLITIIIFKVSLAAIIIKGEIVKPSRPLVISYWNEFSYILDTVKTAKNEFFEKRFDFVKPMHIWINSSFSAFIMPGDTLTLLVNGGNIEYKGNAAQYILFKRKLLEEISMLPQNVSDNEKTKYALAQSDEFFAKYKHKKLFQMRKLNETEIVLSLKLTSLLLRYNNNTNKLDSILNFIKLKQLDSNYVSNSSLLSFLDKITFKNEWLDFKESLNTFNNLVRITRFNMIVNDKKLETSDPYLIDRKIIISMFPNAQFANLLTYYNLNDRIESSEDLKTLAVTKQYINDLKKQVGNSMNTLLLLEDYKKRESQISSM